MNKGFQKMLFLYPTHDYFTFIQDYYKIRGYIYREIPEKDFFTKKGYYL